MQNQGKELSPGQALVKVKPIHRKVTETDMYIIHSRPLSVYSKRIRKLILKNHSKFTIHALGAAINKAITLLAEVKKKYPLIEYRITSSTETCFFKESEEVSLKERDNEKEAGLRSQNRSIETLINPNTIRLQSLK